MEKTRKPTSIDYAILGLVAHEPLSGYGIRKVFETTAMGNYSNSPGTIYPALKRLSKLYLVEKRIHEESGKDRFHISTKGMLALKKWIAKPLELLDIQRNMDEIMLRFAFMDILKDQNQVIIFLESFRDLSSAYINQLLHYQKTEGQQNPLHGRLSIDHGIMTYKTSLKWCKKTIQLFTKNDQS